MKSPSGLAEEGGAGLRGIIDCNLEPVKIVQSVSRNPPPSGLNNVCLLYIFLDRLIDPDQKKNLTIVP